MEPTLRDGDWLLVDPEAYRVEEPSVGDLVVARDPRSSQRLIVKRVAAVRGDGLLLAGDHPAHSMPEELIGPVPAELVIGRPWVRYWPVGRFGAVGGARPNRW